MHEAAGTAPRDLSIAMNGSGGSGVVTAGEILLDAIARAGFYGLMTRSAGPQIRGGESAVMVRFSSRPVQSMNDRFDLLVGLDWLNVQRFVDEIPLDSDSLILTDPAAGSVPDPLRESSPGVREYPFKDYAKSVPGGRVNMAALGALAALTELPVSALERAARAILAAKGEDTVRASVSCIRSAYSQASRSDSDEHRLPESALPRWNISGNEATGLGALRGGVLFVAAYPITPASEILEWLAPRLERLGGSLLQAEDELASINMIIGASFGGVPAFTATSGPGLSLMMEGIGLAVASETPVLVVDVMRGGPSTGIPTKSEQSDLNIALHGLHGDAPHLVLAPLSIADCVFTTQWAAGLAERLQTAAILLSDQSLAQSRTITPVPADEPPALSRTLPRRAATERYLRYSLTEDGISPMSLPGTTGGTYTADGLEHDEKGTPSSLSRDHRAQLDKRRRKLDDFDYGDAWAEIRGEGRLCLVTWGSATGAVLEAAARLESTGRPARVISLRLLAPLRRQTLLRALSGASTVWVLEQNEGGQLFGYLNAQRVLPTDARSYARPGPLPLRPGEIVSAVSE